VQILLGYTKMETRVRVLGDHVADGSSFPNLQGTELPNSDAARLEAVRFSGQWLRDVAAGFWAGQEWSMRVVDDTDLTLFTLMFVATDSAATSGK